MADISLVFSLDSDFDFDYFSLPNIWPYIDYIICVFIYFTSSQHESYAAWLMLNYLIIYQKTTFTD